MMKGKFYRPELQFEIFKSDINQLSSCDSKMKYLVSIVVDYKPHIG